MKKIFFKNFFSQILMGIFLVISVFFFGGIDVKAVDANTNANTNANANVNVNTNTNTNTNGTMWGDAKKDWSSSGFQIQLSEFDPIKKEAPKTADNQTTTKPKPGDWDSLVKSFLEKISNLFLLVIPIIASVSLIIAGYFYIFSFANDDHVTKAKTIIKYNFIAILVAFGSWVIISTLAGFFS